MIEPAPGSLRYPPAGRSTMTKVIAPGSVGNPSSTAASARVTGVPIGAKCESEKAAGGRGPQLPDSDKFAG